MRKLELTTTLVYSEKGSSARELIRQVFLRYVKAALTCRKS